jgi:aspartyl protease family protein
MPDSEGPWSRPPQPAPPSWRVVVWLAVIAAGGFALWKLSTLFPGSLATTYDQASFVRLLVILVLVSSTIVFARGVRATEVLRNIALWSAVIAVLVLGYTFRSELEDVGARVRSELVPGYPLATGDGTLAVSQAEDGSFHVMGLVNGTRVEFLIDTGASDIVLTPADAERVGLDPKALDYSRRFETAHGTSLGAQAQVASLAIGPIALSNVDVSVNQSEMHNSLLGMAFLKRMDSFEVRGNRLLLHWRK